jgi:cytochrome c5
LRRSPLIVVLLGACTGDLMDVTEQVDASAPPPEIDAPVDPGVDAVPLPPQDGGTLTERVCPEGSFLSYQNFGAPFFSQYCTGCHSSQVPLAMRHDAPEGVDFETLDKIREHMDFIYMDAADGYTKMPPAGGPHPEDRMRLGEWLACGAPE